MNEFLDLLIGLGIGFSTALGVYWYWQGRTAEEKGVLTCCIIEAEYVNLGPADFASKYGVADPAAWKAQNAATGQHCKHTPNGCSATLNAAGLGEIVPGSWPE